MAIASERLSTQWLDYYRKIAQQVLAVVDLETTGGVAYKHRVTEISVLRASLTEGVIEHQTDLINPERWLPPIIVKVTGITQEMVDAAPPAKEIFPRYLPLLDGGVLTAHNIEFDYSFLRAEYSRLGTNFRRSPDNWLCTVELSRLMLADLPSRSLPDLVRHFEFSVPTSHRAAPDTLACWMLAERLLREICSEPDEMILSRFGQQWIPLKIAARILGCFAKKAQTQLEKAGVPHRSSQRDGATLMYRRGDVERVYYERQG